MQRALGLQAPGCLIYILSCLGAGEWQGAEGRRGSLRAGGEGGSERGEVDGAQVRCEAAKWLIRGGL